MTHTPTDTASYRDAVERHLDALLQEIRLDLAAGLRAHLADVAAGLRPGETLEHRLGSPEACAAAVLGFSSALETFAHDHATAPPPRPVFTA
jgi:hypothetical protein